MQQARAPGRPIAPCCAAPLPRWRRPPAPQAPALRAAINLVHDGQWRRRVTIASFLSCHTDSVNVHNVLYWCLSGMRSHACYCERATWCRPWSASGVHMRRPLSSACPSPLSCTFINTKACRSCPAGSASDSRSRPCQGVEAGLGSLACASACAWSRAAASRSSAVATAAASSPAASARARRLDASSRASRSALLAQPCHSRTGY
jgi:hypothetical protein